MNGTDTNTYVEFVDRIKALKLEPYISGLKLRLAVANATREYLNTSTPTGVDMTITMYNAVGVIVHREPPISFERLIWLLEAAGSYDTLMYLASGFPQGIKLGPWTVTNYDRKAHTIASFVTLELDQEALPENVTRVLFDGRSSDLGWNDWVFHVTADLGEGERDYWLALISKDWDNPPRVHPTEELQWEHRDPEVRRQGVILGHKLAQLLPHLGLFDFKPQHKRVKGGFKQIPVNEYLIGRWLSAPWR